MKAAVYVNGRVTGEDQAMVSVFDHGFLYGEGVYETLRTYNRQPFLFGRHLARLRASAGRLELPTPWTDPELSAAVQKTVGQLDEGGEAYIRIMVTRGVGDLSYSPEFCVRPTLVVVAKEHVPPPAELYERGGAIALVSIIRNHPGSVDPIIKSNNLLNNALAMQQALKVGAIEALMKNYRGEIAECSQSNFFLVRDGVALTPPVDAGLLAGITRQFLIEIGPEIGIEVREAVLREQDLWSAQEAFFTSTTRELVPVVRVDGSMVGSGRPGPVTRRLLAEFRTRALVLTRHESL